MAKSWRVTPIMQRQIVHAKQVTVEREGKEATVQIPKDLMNRLMASETPLVESCRTPYVIDSVMSNGGFAKAGGAER